MHTGHGNRIPKLFEILPYVDALAQSKGQSLDYTLFVLLVRRMARQGARSQEELVSELQQQFELEAESLRKARNQEQAFHRQRDAQRTASSCSSDRQQQYDRSGQAFSL